MTIIIEELKKDNLEQYASIPITYETDYELRPYLAEDGLGGIIFKEEKLEKPLYKDYDHSQNPTDFAKFFDISNWIILIARDDKGEILGGATVAFNTKGVHILEGRDDLAVLWDIRVSPKARGLGVGKRLFAAAEKWANEKGCTQIKVETQNNNPAACEFYVAQGCRLGGLNRFAYIKEPECAHEVMLLWYKDLR